MEVNPSNGDLSGPNEPSLRKGLFSVSHRPGSNVWRRWGNGVSRCRVGHRGVCRCTSVTSGRRSKHTLSEAAMLNKHLYANLLSPAETILKLQEAFEIIQLNLN